MSTFTISYEDAKKLLGVFYNSPYQVSAPYVDILHAMKGNDERNFKEHLETERASVTAPQEAVVE